MPERRREHSDTIALNRRAHYDYILLERLEAGLVLSGTEVKSLRQHRVDIVDSFARLERGEAWLYQMHISPYEPAAQFNEDPKRPRKLLLHKKEIDRLKGAVARQGYTIVPTRLYFSGRRAKVELALARGKKQYDKRQAIKEEEERRQIRRALRRPKERLPRSRRRR